VHVIRISTFSPADCGSTGAAASPGPSFLGVRTQLHNSQLAREVSGSVDARKPYTSFPVAHVFADTEGCDNGRGLQPTGALCRTFARFAFGLGTPGLLTEAFVRGAAPSGIESRIITRTS